jgi:hypothetical protein
MKKIKIALHFYGHLRTFKECLPSVVEKIIKKNECDVFMHTWDEYERSTDSWHKSEISTDKITQDDIEFIEKIFPNFNYLVEKQENKNKSEETGLLRAHESLRKSLLLRKDNFDEPYDIVIITRPDILFLKDIDVEVISFLLKDSHFESRLIQGSYNYPTDSLWVDDSYGGRECLMFANQKSIEKLIKIKSDESILKAPKFIHRTGEIMFDNLLLKCGLGREIIKISAPDFWVIKRKNSLVL